MIYRYTTRLERDQALALAIADQLTHTLQIHGQASLAVSGGSTPEPLFKQLSTLALDWSNITVTLVDERWVPNTHPDSNERLVRNRLLSGPAAAARFLPLKSEHATPAAAVKQLEHQLRSLPLPFTIVLLGMGEDGHTASWFADAPEFNDTITSTHLCAAITPQVAPHPRMTLTPKALLAADKVFLMVNGEAKWQVLRNAIDAESPPALPIRYVLGKTQNTLDTYWGP